MNVLIVYGGESCEHDISIITACLAKGYFDENVISAYIDQKNRCFWVPDNLAPKEHKSDHFEYELMFMFGHKQIAAVRHKKIKKIFDVDVVVNCCHGRCGEDGTIAALCNLTCLPLVGCNIIEAALTMDKFATKSVLASLNFPVVNGVLLQDLSQNSLEKAETLEYPVIVKPRTLGSSIGITVCNNRAELADALKTAFEFDKSVLCEKALTNFYELNCAVMHSPSGKTEMSCVERPIASHDILTFQDKYERGEKGAVLAGVEADDEVAAAVKQMTLDIYEKLNLSGVVRIDYLVTENKIYVNEINSVPGSLAYGLWQKKYLPKQFGNILLHQAIVDFVSSEKLMHSFASGVLNGIGSMKK